MTSALPPWGDPSPPRPRAPDGRGSRRADSPSRRGSRRPGDGWVSCRCGHRHWGTNGAAGVLVWRPHRGRAGQQGCPGEPDDATLEVLLQLRAPWTHHGSTWGVPGGAVADGEPPAQAALRELEEETGLPAHHLVLGGSQVQRHPDWSYTTFVGQAPRDGTWDHPVPVDGESTALEWTLLTPRPGTSTWQAPVPSQASQPQGGAPLLPALRSVWDELAALLPPPGRTRGGRRGTP